MAALSPTTKTAAEFEVDYEVEFGGIPPLSVAGVGGTTDDDGAYACWVLTCQVFRKRDGSDYAYAYQVQLEGSSKFLNQTGGLAIPIPFPANGTPSTVYKIAVPLGDLWGPFEEAPWVEATTALAWSSNVLTLTVAAITGTYAKKLVRSAFYVVIAETARETNATTFAPTGFTGVAATRTEVFGPITPPPPPGPPAGYSSRYAASDYNATTGVWTDTGSDPHDATALTTKPTVVDGGIVFNGTSDALATTGAGGSMTQPYTRFFVIKPEIQSNGYVFDGGGANQGVFTIFDAATYLMYAGSPGTKTVSDTTVKAVLTAAFDGASSIIAVNGDEQTVSIGSGNTTGFTIGHYAGGAQFYKGVIYEIVTYPGVPEPEDRAAVVEYLMTTYGIS